MELACMYGHREWISHLDAVAGTKRPRQNSAFAGCLKIFFTIILITLFGCVEDDNGLNANESLSTGNSGATIRLTLVNANDGSATTTITPDNPAQVIATVLDGNDDPVVSQIVAFASELGQLDANAGTALTGTNGVAQIGLLAGSTTGVGTVTASISLTSGETLQGSLNFTITEVAVTNTDTTAEEVQIALALTSNDSNANTIRVDAPGTLTVTVTDGVDPLANQIVSITAALSNLNPTNGVLLTDANGVATLVMTPNGTTGADTINASITIGEATFTSTLGYAIAPPTIRIGSIESSVFTENTLALDVTSLAAGGTALVSVAVVDTEDNPVSESYTINFSSACAENALAVIDSAVLAPRGSATATYRATGCVGTDTITASLLVGTTLFTATANIGIADDTAGSLEYVSVSPTLIALQGAGGQGLSETSTITFRLLGAQGLPISNEQINFSLTTTVGGISLITNSARTDSNGLANAIVQSGSIATSVGVIATLNGTNLSSQSEQLNITTGVPDQDSMTLSLSIQNPEAGDFFGETVTATAYLADMFNNPVPDGTAVSFTAEGGQIQGACTTTSGTCNVTWTSQNPLPAADSVTGRALRVTILASAIGGESFSDEDGDGVFSVGDTVSDLTEAFRDDNEDGTRTGPLGTDPAEPYIDFNTNGEFDGVDTKYSGPLCEHTTDCADQDKLTVRDSSVLVMSTSNLNITFSAGSPLNLNAQDTVTVTVADQNGNAPPFETTIAIEATNGELETASNYTVESRTEPFSFVARILPDEESDSGSLIITTETPKGILSSGFLTITD